ncbi:exonuclease SbcCD subunit D [Halalkalibacter sp. APA_J-10(15)]|uniref:metallophosphoesterase family protein n=1 Tax=unclassified Halalkalibacter TaxID=2893063 RepID=UPI001FF24DC4|nr:exonuclease SbcCD subunit D [Halalkalibacter sp. APA_J-10(15)]MCK0470827.1 exonuclease SbcCD subunit D [Halalkalibacter sp. APA_J-10(15)]
MKFLYVTDTHIRGTTPKNRLDSYVDTLKKKLDEVISMANEEQVDVILHGGDVFDRPDLSPNVVGQFAKIFKRANAPIYVVAGNHDTFGHNPETLSRTMLGLMDSFGVMTVIHPEQPLLLEFNGVHIQISGQPYHYDLDQRDPKLDYYPTRAEHIDVAIHIVHSMLVEKALPDGVAHTLIDHIWGTTADITLTGHFHGGFGIKEREGKFICNPGALARVNNHWSEISRKPKVIVGTIERNKVNLQEKTLTSSEAGDAVLDRSFLEKAVHQEEKLHSFVQQVKEASQFQSLKMSDIIQEIASLQNVEEKVKKEALRRMTQVEEKWKDGEYE